jgi:hypothetical protein
VKILVKNQFFSKNIKRMGNKPLSIVSNALQPVWPNDEFINP